MVILAVVSLTKVSPNKNTIESKKEPSWSEKVGILYQNLKELGIADWEL